MTSTSDNQPVKSEPSHGIHTPEFFISDACELLGESLPDLIEYASMKNTDGGDFSKLVDWVVEYEVKLKDAGFTVAWNEDSQGSYAIYGEVE